MVAHHMIDQRAATTDRLCSRHHPHRSQTMRVQREFEQGERARRDAAFDEDADLECHEQQCEDKRAAFEND